MSLKRTGGTTPGIGSTPAPLLPDGTGDYEAQGNIDLGSYAISGITMDSIDNVDVASAVDGDGLIFSEGSIAQVTSPIPTPTVSQGSNPEYLVDANDGTAWRTYGRQLSLWMSFDFGENVTLSRVQVTQNTGAWSAAAMSVRTSANGTDWNLVQAYTGQSSGAVDLDFTETTSRYWRVTEEDTTANDWQVQEVRFYLAANTWVPVSPNTWLDALFTRPSDETVHADDQEFDGTIGGTALTVSGIADWTQKRSLLSVEYDNQSSEDLAMRAYSLTPTSSPVTVETAMSSRHLHSSGLSGLFFSDGVTATDSQIFGSISRTSNVWYALNYNGTFTAASASDWTQQFEWTSSHIYMRLIWSAANTFKRFYSHDGISWTDWDNGADSFTLTPTHFGVFGSTWSGTQQCSASFEYLRVTESDLSV